MYVFTKQIPPVHSWFVFLELLSKAEQLKDKNKTEIEMLCESVKCHDCTECNRTPSIYTCERSDTLGFQD